MILAWYFFRRWLAAVATAGITFLLFLLIEDVYRMFSEWIHIGFSVRAFFIHCGVLAPRLLCDVLPMATLLGTLYSVNSAQEKNEIIAIEMGGLGLRRIFRPLLIGGIALSGLMLWLQFFTIGRVANLEASINFKNESGIQVLGKDRNIAFANAVDQRLWLIENLQVNKGLAYGVFILESGCEMRKIYCADAEFRNGIWHLHGGVESKIGSVTGLEEHRKSFEEMEENFSETPRQMAMQSKRIKNLSMGELRELMQFENLGSRKMREYAMRYHGLWIHCLSALFSVYFAIPFAISKPRVNAATNMVRAVMIFLSLSIAGKWIHLIGSKGWASPGFVIWVTFFSTISLCVFWGHRRTNL
ncbi:MAG: LptF/LptG family permease [Puniceicoccales bacterium]|nr:LptF/LptG family permease [Puniceicoccales bacterium]